jgi:hypothetical protein
VKNEMRRKSQLVKQHNEQTTSEIQLRAYELWEARGRTDGGDVEDWLQAESEVTGKKVRANAG